MPRRAKATTYGERIQRILDTEKLKAAEFARAIGVTRATVREWLSGRSGLPRADVPFKIEDQFGYVARWIATGEGPVKLLTLDPADSGILQSLTRIEDPSRKKEIQTFVDYQLNR